MRRQALYLMKAGDWYKIGVAYDPDARAKQLQTGCPFSIEVIQASDDGAWRPGEVWFIERQLHNAARMVALEHHGEWFRFATQDDAEDVYYEPFKPIVEDPPEMRGHG